MQVQSNALKQYDAILELSGRMLAAARRDDWDTVIAEERRCRMLVSVMQSAEEIEPSEDERVQKSAIIRKLLTDDAEIRNLAQPWLQHLEGLLTSSGNSRKLDLRYGTQP